MNTQEATEIVLKRDALGDPERLAALDFLVKIHQCRKRMRQCDSCRGVGLIKRGDMQVHYLCSCTMGTDPEVLGEINPELGSVALGRLRERPAATEA